jgi:hypothetical protein
VSALADPFDGRRAVVGSGLLRAFNDAGVLAAADVHVALRLAALSGDADEHVALAAALAVRDSGTYTSTSRRSATPRRSSPRTTST